MSTDYELYPEERELREFVTHVELLLARERGALSCCEHIVAVVQV